MYCALRSKVRTSGPTNMAKPVEKRASSPPSACSASEPSSSNTSTSSGVLRVALPESTTRPAAAATAASPRKLSRDTAATSSKAPIPRSRTLEPLRSVVGRASPALCRPSRAAVPSPPFASPFLFSSAAAPPDANRSVRTRLPSVACRLAARTSMGSPARSRRSRRHAVACRSISRSSSCTARSAALSSASPSQRAAMAAATKRCASSCLRSSDMRGVQYMRCSGDARIAARIDLRSGGPSTPLCASRCRAVVLSAVLSASVSVGTLDRAIEQFRSAPGGGRRTSRCRCMSPNTDSPGSSAVASPSPPSSAHSSASAADAAPSTSHEYACRPSIFLPSGLPSLCAYDTCTGAVGRGAGTRSCSCCCVCRCCCSCRPCGCCC
mmetsp:Transcript_22048/g.68186  ORF Transcript_22048/g.68186 Transcript_22048/m.68186 type:complete len:381 (+) Transcript_22048:1693-2835(+)